MGSDRKERRRAWFGGLRGWAWDLMFKMLGCLKVAVAAPHLHSHSCLARGNAKHFMLTSRASPRPGAAEHGL